MVRILYWSILPVVGDFVIKRSRQCINLCAGLACGMAQVVGVEIFTQDSVNEALALKEAASACTHQLPIKLTTEHDEVAQIMSEGGKGAVLKAKAVMKNAAVEEKCIAIFGLVCSKAEQFNALDIIK